MEDEGRSGARTRPAIPRRIGSERAHVLLVEDEPLLRGSLVELLRPRFDVSAAEHGGVALRLIEEDAGRSIAVVVSDVRMPWMHGVELHRTLSARAHPLAERFVWMSAGGLSEGLSQYVRASGLPLLEKPFSQSTLEHAIESHLPLARPTHSTG